MPTLTTYRRIGAALAGRYSGVLTVNSTGNTTTTAVIDAIKSSISQDDLFTDHWLHAPDEAAADRVRIVTTYAPATGTLTVDRAVAAATTYDSTTVELHGFLDPTTGALGAGWGWTDALNEALKRIMFEEEITVTPTASATRHDLTTANTWLIDPSWVRDVGYLVTGETRANVDPYRNRHVRGFSERVRNLVYINHDPRTFASNETIYVKVLKPAYNMCRASGGAYGDQNGLSLGTDEAIPFEELVAWGAILEATIRHRNAIGGKAEDLDEQQQTAALAFSSLLIKHSDTVQTVPEYFRPARSFGPAYR